MTLTAVISLNNLKDNRAVEKTKVPNLPAISESTVMLSRLTGKKLQSLTPTLGVRLKVQMSTKMHIHFWKYTLSVRVRISFMVKC